ncbi:hypothetical protein V2W45_1426683 [Cenococcum geophilum]
MGKHVPSSNLFPTQRVYLSTERVCLPTYLPIDRPINRPYVSLSDACTVLLPK